MLNRNDITTAATDLQLLLNLVVSDAKLVSKGKAWKPITKGGQKAVSFSDVVFTGTRDPRGKSKTIVTFSESSSLIEKKRVDS